MGKNSTPSQEATFAFIYKDQVFIADLDEIWHDFSAFRTKEVRENDQIVDRLCPKPLWKTRLLFLWWLNHFAHF